MANKKHLKKKKPQDPDIAEGKRMRRAICDIATECEQEFLFADGFEAAIVGFTEMNMGSDSKVVYDWEKCVEILMKDMSEEDALEYMSFNVTGAYVGEHTPIFIRLIK